MPLYDQHGKPIPIDKADGTLYTDEEIDEMDQAGMIEGDVAELKRQGIIRTRPK